MSRDDTAAKERMSEDTATPTTLGDAHAALAAADSSSATPAPETPSAEVSAPAATTQAAETPQETAPVSPEEPPKGEPPTWRWQDIKENLRKKTAEETEARVRAEYEPRLKQYEGVDEATLNGYRVLRAAESGDPQARAMVAQANPQLAHAMGWMQSPAQPEAEPQPDAAIQMADGSTVPVFTPEGMKKWQQWNQKQTIAAMREEFKPVLSTAERLRQQEAEAQRAEETRQWAASVLAPVQRLPHFAEFKPEIQKALTEVPDSFTGDLSQIVYDAYSRLLTAKLESSTKAAETKALTDIHQRAVAATGNPATASTATPPAVLGDALAALKQADAQLNAR